MLQNSPLTYLEQTVLGVILVFLLLASSLYQACRAQSHFDETGKHFSFDENLARGGFPSPKNPSPAFLMLNRKLKLSLFGGLIFAIVFGLLILERTSGA